jgi:hypothetical protein
MRCNKSVEREIQIHRETIYFFFPSFLAMQYEVVQKIKKIWNVLFVFSKAKWEKIMKQTAQRIDSRVITSSPALDLEP